MKLKDMPQTKLEDVAQQLRSIGNVGVHPVHENDRMLVKILQLKPTGPWACGGAALRWYTGQPIDPLTDIDVFVNGEKQFFDMDNWLRTSTKNGFMALVAHDSKNATTFNVTIERPRKKLLGIKRTENATYRVQLIRKHFYKTVDDVLNNFDLSVCKVGTDGRRFYFGEGAADDIRTRTLNYSGPLKHSSYMRILKYETYGYRPSSKLQKQLHEEWNIATDLTGYSTMDEYEFGL